jgi:hypothetical protein
MDAGSAVDPWARWIGAIGLVVAALALYLDYRKHRSSKARVELAIRSISSGGLLSLAYTTLQGSGLDVTIRNVGERDIGVESWTVELQWSDKGQHVTSKLSYGTPSNPFRFTLAGNHSEQLLVEVHPTTPNPSEIGQRTSVRFVVRLANGKKVESDWVTLPLEARPPGRVRRRKSSP